MGHALCVGSSTAAHDHEQLIQQHVGRPNNSSLSIGCQRIEDWTSNTNSGSPKSHCFEDVCAMAGTTVNENRKRLVGGTGVVQVLHDLLRQDLNSLGDKCPTVTHHGSKAHSHARA